MRRSLAEAILKAYEDVLQKLPADAPDSLKIPLLVQFTLGDVRALKRSVDSLDALAKSGIGLRS